MAKKLTALLFAVVLAVCGALSLSCFAEDVHYSYFGQLEDNQGVLTDKQQRELLTLLDDTAREISANVGVVLADWDLDGMTERAYAKAFHNKCFGEYSDSIVLMLVQTGSGKVDQLYMTDAAYDKYYSRMDSIFDAVYDGLDSGGGDNYYAAITEFCDYLTIHSDVGGNGGVSFSIHLNTGHIAGLIVALVITFTVVGSYSATYKKRAPISARAYVDSNMTRITGRQDTFVREYTTSHRISSSSGGSHRGGGGGGHRSGGGGGRRR